MYTLYLPEFHVSSWIFYIKSDFPVFELFWNPSSSYKSLKWVDGKSSDSFYPEQCNSKEESTSGEHTYGKMLKSNFLTSPFSYG